MNKSLFLNKYNDQLILLDGATGTNLQAAGMPVGISPEQWILQHPHILSKLQEDFYEAGSSIVYAFTFGANRIKLDSHGIACNTSDVEEINRKLTLISCNVRDKMRIKYPDREFLVAGDLAPTGSFLSPAGELDFDDLINIYREQVRGQLAAGVDLFVAETMMDLAQARAAVIAVREESDLPVIASVTVDEHGRTLSGNSFEVCLLGLAAAGAQAVGMNCSSGPLQMIDNMSFQAIPADCLLMAKPNAGVPRLNENGLTVFDLSPDNFAKQMMGFIELGVSLIGGCCGTTPSHIAALAQAIKKSKHTNMPNKKMLPPSGMISQQKDEANAFVTSQRQTLSLDNWRKWPVLVCNDLSNLNDELFELLEDEPEAIQIHFIISDLPDIEDFKTAMADLQLTCNLPIIFRCDLSEIQEWVIRYYHGLTAVITTNFISDLSAYQIKI